MSKWRENIWDYGLVGTGYTLSARVRSGVNTGLWIVNNVQPFGYNLPGFFTVIGDLYGSGVLGPSFPKRPFPYGLDVDPP